MLNQSVGQKPSTSSQLLLLGAVIMRALMFVVLLLGIASLSQSQQQERRRRVRVRGRPRKIGFSRNNNLPPPAAQPSGECPEQEGLQVYDDPTNCNNFYKCTNGTLTYERCGNGLLFDVARAFRGAVHNHCHYNWAVDCGDRERDDTRISTGDCPYQYGLYEYGNCHPKYLKCAGGVAQEVPCAVGLVYDPRIHNCNYPDLQIELGCNPSRLLGGFVCPAFEDLSPLEQRFHPFARFAVPDSDRLYIICVDQQPRLRTCGEAAFFDRTTLGCVEEEFF